MAQLVALHGGTVKADSEGEGKGAEFTVYLPALVVPAPEEITTKPAPAISAPSALLAGVRVVLVEERGDARNLMDVRGEVTSWRGATQRGAS